MQRTPYIGKSLANLKTSDSPRLLHRIDPLFDPAIVYLFVTGLLKPVIFAITAVVDSELLYQPVVGYIWTGFDSIVIANSFAYLVLAAGLMAVRNRNRGQKLANIYSKRTARQLSVILLLLATGSIVEGRFLSSHYIAVIMTSIYLGWISVVCEHLRFRTVLLISAFLFYATLSKWMVISFPFFLTVNTSIWGIVILLAVYPLLNQIRFFFIGLALGYSVVESIAFLTIAEFSILRSLVSLFYRLQSFEGVYLIDLAGLFDVHQNASVFGLSNFISDQVFGLDYGLALSLFSQLTFLTSDPWYAAIVLIGGVAVFALVARQIVRVLPSLSLVLGLFIVIVLSDGFVFNRVLYFFVGTIGFVVFLSLSQLRLRLSAPKDRLSGPRQAVGPRQS